MRRGASAGRYVAVALGPAVESALAAATVVAEEPEPELVGKHNQPVPALEQRLEQWLFVRSGLPVPVFGVGKSTELVPRDSA